MANQFVKLFREVLDGTGAVVTPAYEEVTLEAPTWGSVPTTGDYYLNGQWYDKTGALYLTQFTYLSKDGKLAEVETANGVPVDVHYDKLAPDLVRHTIKTDSLIVGGDSVTSVVGTVSQTAGVPTGAIIESGSNANGSYVKYADGSITCWTGPEWTTEFVSDTDTSVAVPWTFPVVFISAPTVVGNCATRSSTAPDVESVAFGIGGVYEASTTSVSVYHTTNRSTPVAFGSTLQAIGRWF